MLNWQISAPQFAALWKLHPVELTPPVFNIFSLGDLTQQEGFTHDVHEAFNNHEHEPLLNAIRVLAEPEIHVQVGGYNAQSQPIRIIAAQVQSMVAIALQLPGPSRMEGGDIVVAYGHAGNFGAQIVGVLPANAAGKRTFAPRQENQDEDEYDNSASILVPVITTAAPVELPRLEDAMSQAVGVGSIEVLRGPRHVRDASLYKLKWIDIAGDGRYVIGPKDFDRAVAADPPKITRRVDAMLNAALERVRGIAN